MKANFNFEKIYNVNETMFIPLFARALQSKSDRNDFKDIEAENAVSKLGVI